MAKGKGKSRRGNGKVKKAKKAIGQAFGVGYLGAEAITAKSAYDEAAGTQAEKAFAALKAKVGVVGKEYGLPADEFRASTLWNQHKYAVGVGVVDVATEKLGIQKWAAKRLARFM